VNRLRSTREIAFHRVAHFVENGAIKRSTLVQDVLRRLARAEGVEETGVFVRTKSTGGSLSRNLARARSSAPKPLAAAAASQRVSFALCHRERAPLLAPVVDHPR